jgi:uncharacterized protein YjbJ (UPF0337 family)
MDEDRIKGTVNDLAGKAKDAVGGLTGDTRTQAEGKYDQAYGQTQRAFGQAKDAASDLAQDAQQTVASIGQQLDSVLKDQPVTALLAAVSVGYVLALLIHRRH